MLITLFYSIISSQTYFPFPESNTYWRYSSHDIPMICGCWGVCSEEQHKIEHSGYWINDNCDEKFFSFGYQGAFRNDIENKKVWFVPEGEENEAILYEFDLEIGDTLSEGILDPNDYWGFWVENIDSVEVGDSFRKRFHISSYPNMSEMPLYIIEGIGGQNLIEPFASWFYFEVGYMLACININDSIIYPQWSDCELIVNTKSNFENSHLKMFPNPSTGKFWIKNVTYNQKSISIEIYNSFGEKLEQYESSELLTPIDLSANSKGIYFIRIRFGSRNLIKKIILQ